jgi:hypothetical protein
MDIKATPAATTSKLGKQVVALIGGKKNRPNTTR